MRPGVLGELLTRGALPALMCAWSKGGIRVSPRSAASSVATMVPRLDAQIGATVVGSVILAFYYLRSRPAKVDVPA